MKFSRPQAFPIAAHMTWDEWSKKYLTRNQCKHEVPIIRYIVCSNGVKQYKVQCQSCGKVSGRALEYKLITGFNPLPMHDRWTEENDEENERVYMEYRSSKQEHWAKEYREYMMSPEWEQRRNYIYELRGGVCEQCSSPLWDGSTTWQLHHKTYDRVGDEDDDDLSLVCKPCHEQIHGRVF